MENKSNKSNKNVPRGTLTKPSLEAVREYQLFLVVAFDSAGVASPVYYTEDYLHACDFAEKLVCPLSGNRLRSAVVPLEIPRRFLQSFYYGLPTL